MPRLIIRQQKLSPAGCHGVQATETRVEATAESTLPPLGKNLNDPSAPDRAQKRPFPNPQSIPPRTTPSVLSLRGHTRPGHVEGALAAAPTGISRCSPYSLGCCEAIHRWLCCHSLATWDLVHWR